MLRLVLAIIFSAALMLSSCNGQREEEPMQEPQEQMETVPDTTAADTAAMDTMM